MNEIIVFDTSVLIDHLRSNCHAERMGGLEGAVMHSSVVLSELWRGVKTEPEKRLLVAFEQSGPLLMPSEEDWIDSGRVLAEMKKKQGFEPPKQRDLHFDVLIALTARAHGARLVTSNRGDFELIRAYRAFKLEIW